MQINAIDFRLVVSWLDLQRQRLLAEADFENTMANYTRTAMLCVRFPMMSPRQLADLLLSPLVTKYKDFFLDRLALGMAFHSNDKAR
jgi:BTB/POZ domain-containing protein 17